MEHLNSPNVSIRQRDRTPVARVSGSRRPSPKRGFDEVVSLDRDKITGQLEKINIALNGLQNDFQEFAATLNSAPSRGSEETASAPSQAATPTKPAAAARPGPPQAQCCDCSENIRQAFAAFLPGFISSAGIVVFSKDVAEAAVAAAIAATGNDPTIPPYSYIVAIVPGLWYGATHQFVSRLTTGLLNSSLGLDRLSAKGATEGQRQWRDFYATTAPGLISYTLCHAARGTMTGGWSDIWALGFSKLAASSLAGGIGGVISNALQQANPQHFKRTSPADSTIVNLKNELRSLVAEMTHRRLWRDYIGKTLASPSALAAAVPLTHQELPGAIGSASNGAGEAALGKLIFQAGFYLGIHAGAWGGNQIDSCRLNTGDNHGGGVEAGVGGSSEAPDFAVADNDAEAKSSSLVVSDGEASSQI